MSIDDSEPGAATPPPELRPKGILGARTVASDLASVSGARLLSAVISVATVGLTTRILDPTNYALVAYVSVASGLIFTATSAWTAAAVARYGRDELERRAHMRSTSWNRLAITFPLVVLSMLLIVGLRLIGALPAEMTWTFTGLAVASGILQIGSEHVITLLEAAGRMRLTAGLLTLRQVAATAVLLAILISGRGRTPLVVVLLGVAALGVVTALMANRVWRVGLWPPTIDRVLLRRMLAFSLPLIAFSASQYVIQSADIVILRAHGTRADAGVYAIAYQGYTVLQAIPTTISIVLTPLFVSIGTANREDLIRRYVSRVTAQITFAAATIGAVVVGFTPVAIGLVFGPGFSRAAEPFAILLIALVLYARASLLAPVLVLAERTRSIAVISMVAAVVNLTGDVLFVVVFHLGVAGPAIATALALAVIAAGYAMVAAQCTGVPAGGVTRLLIPQIAATVTAVTLSEAMAIPASLALALVLTAAILKWASPFSPGDADLVGKLDLPDPIKRFLVRTLMKGAPG